MRDGFQSEPPLFRREALEQLARDGEEGEALRIAPPWTWALSALVGLGAILLLGYLAFGSVEMSTTVRGVLRPSVETPLLLSEGDGILAAAMAQNGDRVRRGQPLFVVASSAGARVVSSPEDGVIQAFAPQVGGHIREGSLLGVVIAENSPLRVVTFLPWREITRLRPGESLSVEVEGFPPSKFGFMRGCVVETAGLPAASYEVAEAFGPASRQGEPLFRLAVDLVDHNSWFSKAAPPAGTVVQVHYAAGRRRLLDLALGTLTRRDE